jgi:PAS domain S-box-containing protein
MTEEKGGSDSFADLRRRAESQRDASPEASPERSGNIDNLSPQEVRHLLHELQVHQIELEMQNDELRRTQQQLEASRDRYADLYDFAPVGYFTLSEASLILEVNLTAAAMLGLERGHLIQQPLTRFILREDQDIYYFHRRQLFETGSPQVCEIRLVSMDGSQFHARLEAIPVQGNEGQTRCRVTVSDITQQVQAESQRDASLKSLRESEERFRLAFENANVGMCLVDTEGRFTRVNSQLCEIFGYSREELEGINVNDITHPDYRDISPGFIQRASSGEIAQTRFEKQYYHKQGHIVWGQVTSSLVRDGKGRPSYFISHVQDVTGRKKAEEKLKRLNEELENRVERRTRALYRQATELEALVNVSSALREAVSVEETISILMEETVNALEAQAAIVLLLEDGALMVAGLSGPSGTALGHRDLPGDDAWWQVVNTGQPMLLNSVEQAGLASSQISPDLARDMRAIAIVPLRASEETLGLLQIAFGQPDRPFEEYLRPLTAIGEMGGSALQRVRVTEMLEQLAQDRMRDLAALYEVTTTTTQHLDTQIILESVLGQALEVTGADAGFIHLLDDGGETPRMAVQRGLPPELMTDLQVESLSASLWGQVIERKETVVVPDLASELPTLQPLYPAAYATYIGLPIYTTGPVLGVLSVLGETIQKFSAEDIALLAAIANHVGAAVESAQLRQRAEQAAVMEERQRLARELHDSVTQSLYSLTLFAEAGMDSARAADLKQVRYYLGRMGETAQQALKGMRLLIFESRPLALRQEGLVGALRQRLEAVERRAGVETQLLAETPFELPDHVETGLYGIVQEALNNVLKHSAATRVMVRIGADDEGLRLEVIDNGQGFELGSAGDQGGIGLASMQERVEKLAGTLQIVSKPGQGTSIQVAIPWARSA